ncbi:MAG: hypothetical protein EOO10_15505 [Chitinophagaceae bacterium]|nr:MAG: hypothetical protein EOO10_15505 [Chitinophagaceae bacterium]
MDASYLQNITRIKVVAKALEPLEQKVVFVGGATIALYTNPAITMELRPTDDVDVVVEIATYDGYARLEERLRKIGFVNDQDAKVVCRYIIRGIIVDIMPTDPAIIGFSNKWYREGFEKAIVHPLTEKDSIYIFPLEYIVATKLEAFLSRGKMDFLFSRDFEDLVYLLENAIAVEEKLLGTTGTLNEYLKITFKNLLAHPDFEEGLHAHLFPRHAAFQAERIKRTIKTIIHGN